MQAAPKVQYVTCNRGGYHTGEALNMVCLEQKCTEQLCCCACIEQSHKDHHAKPLRLVMLEAEQASKKVTPTIFNIDIALELLNTHLKETMEIFSKHKKQFISSLDNIEISLQNYYSFLADQIKLKNVDPKLEIQQAFETIQAKVIDPVQYAQAVRKIACVLNAKRDDRELTESDIISSLNTSNELTRKKLEANIESVNKLLEKCQQELNGHINDANLWKQAVSYKFSPTLKHADIKIISDHVVKSANNSGYKFIIMEPHLETGTSIKKFAFKIKQSSSNWVAIGMCHPKIVASKNYGFNFSSIGHGAYMVSANGGSWSHTKAEQNNSVKAFKFAKGDTIEASMNPADKTITFKRNTDSYVVNYETIANDELSPCVLFYYINDEIEFLPNFKG